MAKTILSLKGSLDSQGTVTCSIGDALTFRTKGKRPKTAGEIYAFDVALEALRQSVLHKRRAPTLEIEHFEAGESKIPVLCIAKNNAKKLPLVVFVHGYTGDKIGSIRAGVQLAQAGFFTVMLDARMHGERRPANFEDKFEKTFAKTFLQVIKGTSSDISALVDYFGKDRRVDADRLGVSGISMGGFITFLAAIREKRIKAAAPIIGTPDFLLLNADTRLPPLDAKTELELEKHSPLLSPQKMKHVALLVQNGAKDKIVPPTGTRKLDKLLTKPGQTLRAYRYIEYPDTAHEVPDAMITQTLKWFGKYL